MDDTYSCSKCNWEWGFYPEDFDFIEEDYPTMCPLCSMPITQMLKEVYREEGIIAAIKRLFKIYE